jgi:hypothetical protein
VDRLREERERHADEVDGSLNRAASFVPSSGSTSPAPGGEWRPRCERVPHSRLERRGSPRFTQRIRFPCAASSFLRAAVA